VVAKRGPRHAPGPRPGRRRRGPAAAADRATTIGEWLVFLGAKLDDPEWFPVWPPDAFAFAAALFARWRA
jgi:hypothetical protein